jgi:acetate kinase
MIILVINSGSSSIKYALFDMENRRELLRRAYDGLDSSRGGGKDHASAVRQILASVAGEYQIDGVGHRVVHGGTDFYQPTYIDKQVLERIRCLNHLAPLHNPCALQGIDVVSDISPQIPQIAVFDTGFFHSLPEYAWRYALPKEMADQFLVRRYGFHGISHHYVAERAAEILQRPLDSLKLITLHLGNGASATAIRYGVPVDTSMGMTPLEGLVMGSRVGDLDPSVPGYLQLHGNMQARDVDDLLNRRSGLRGLCGESDMRRIRQRIGQGDNDARLAVQIYGHRLRKYIGAYMAVLDGCDALVFTGGIGEHDAVLRAEVCDGLGAFGFCLDASRNLTNAQRVSPPETVPAVLVIATNEEFAIAKDTHRCLNN